MTSVRSQRHRKNNLYIYYVYIFKFLTHILLYQLYYLLQASGIPEYIINFETLDLFFGRPDDDSIDSKHVAIRIICVINCCLTENCTLYELDKHIGITNVKFIKIGLFYSVTY
jgi:hypothetical protein